MGKIKKTGGNLLIDGKQESLHKYQQIVGFVPQDDVLMKELTGIFRPCIAFDFPSDRKHLLFG